MKRELPLNLVLRLLFGGFNNQFGWAFFGLGSVFSRLFIPMAVEDVGVLWVLLFPAVGLGFLQAGLRRGLRGVLLLREGTLATGRLVAKERTNVWINEEQVWELTFEFMAGDGRPYAAKARSHHPDRLEDEAEESLVYNPSSPEQNELLDDLPGRPRFDDQRVWLTSRGSRPLNLLLPAATVFVHLAWGGIPELLAALSAGR